MKMVMIAALFAASLPAAAAQAQAAEPPHEESVTQSQGRVAEPSLGDGQESESSQAAAAREDKPKKRKSTGDKVLTGAAVVLGLGALAIGGLVVAIFVS